MWAPRYFSVLLAPVGLVVKQVAQPFRFWRPRSDTPWGDWSLGYRKDCHEHTLATLGNGSSGLTPGWEWDVSRLVLHWSRGDFIQPLVTGIGILGFPKIEVERVNPREISRQVLLSLCSSTREAAQKKDGSSEPAGGWLCLAAFISSGQSRVAPKSRLFEKGRLVEFSMLG